ncbi:MAG: Crp/Fnr family transcriptional regulator [Deltaproteobacteria bacterium]|nr:Crp/Fnr family transcriptional regulator [Deltaproteobacteria bacterium]
MTDSLFVKYGRNVKAGELIFSAGEKGAEMFVVRSGAVRVSMTSNGVDKTLAVLGPGEFVGEMSLLNDQPRTATAVAEEDSELLVIGARVLEEMIVHNTEIALRLIRKLARRLESADSLIAVLLHRDAGDRVIENLKRLVKLHGKSDGGEVRLIVDTAAMAEQVGLALAEAQDILSRLVRAGAVIEEGGAWVIKEPERLGEFQEFLKLKEQFA